jgi:hypothetical protein
MCFFGGQEEIKGGKDQRPRKTMTTVYKWIRCRHHLQDRNTDLNPPTLIISPEPENVSNSKMEKSVVEIANVFFWGARRD